MYQLFMSKDGSSEKVQTCCHGNCLILDKLILLVSRKYAKRLEVPVIGLRRSQKCSNSLYGKKCSNSLY